MLSSALTLTLLPISVQAENTVQLAISKQGEASAEFIEANQAETYFHLVLLPLIPLQIWKLKHPEYRCELYRRVLLKFREKEAQQGST